MGCSWLSFPTLLATHPPPWDTSRRVFIMGSSCLDFVDHQNFQTIREIEGWSFFILPGKDIRGKIKRQLLRPLSYKTKANSNPKMWQDITNLQPCTGIGKEGVGGVHRSSGMWREQQTPYKADIGPGQPLPASGFPVRDWPLRTRKSALGTGNGCSYGERQILNIWRVKRSLSVLDVLSLKLIAI